MFVGIGLNLVRGGGSASPASLFAAGEPGVWYDPSDLTTLFTDSAGTIPVTAPNQTVGKMLDKSGRGNHATQATLGQRPTYGINPIVGTRNLLTYTEQFDNAYWAKGAASISANAIAAPDGTTTADKLVENTSPTEHIIRRSGIGTGQKTASVYFKAGERTQAALYLYNATDGVSVSYFDLSAGTVISGTGTISSVGNGWYRCTQTRTSTATDEVVFCPAVAGNTVYLGNGTSGIYVWGAQIEVSATATAYQKVVTQYEVTEAGVASASYISFDGTDDSMVIPSLSLTGAEQLFFCFGAQRLSTTSNTFLMTFGKGGNSAPTYPGFALSIRGSSSPTYAPQLVTASATVSGSLLGSSSNTFGDAATRVLSATRTVLRVNASALATIGSLTNFDGWVTQNNRLGCNYNFANNQFWKGNIYSAIFVASAVTTGQITSTESWVNGKTGAMTWILTQGTWYDDGQWYDTATWTDGV